MGHQCAKMKKSICMCVCVCVCVCVCMLATQSCPTLCDPMDCSLPGSSVHGILQAWILAWVAIPFFRVFSQPREGTQFSHTAGRFFTIWATREEVLPSLNNPCHFCCCKFSKVLKCTCKIHKKSKIQMFHEMRALNVENVAHWRLAVLIYQKMTSCSRSAWNLLLLDLISNHPIIGYHRLIRQGSFQM